jgi:hypothetical protein
VAEEQVVIGIDDSASSFIRMDAAPYRCRPSFSYFPSIVQNYCSYGDCVCINGTFETFPLYVPWTSLVLAYTPLVVALLVPVRSTFVMGKSVLFPCLVTVLTDH